MGSNPTLSATSSFFVIHVKDLIPPAFRPAVRSLYHRTYRFGLGVEWWVRDRLSQHPALPPAKLRFRVGESSEPRVFLDVGRRTADNVRACLAAVGFELRPGMAALDFGCGCGRTLRWLTREWPDVSWHGTDVDAEAVAWSRSHLPGRFEVNGPLPPLAFPDRSFDVVIGVSVFTHLDEPVQRAWAEELRRVLRPGGVALLSFYAEHVWRATEDAAAIERGEFVFRRSTKLKGIVPEGYHTAFQNRDRIRRMLGEWFGQVEFVDRGFGDHDGVVVAAPDATISP